MSMNREFGRSGRLTGLLSRVWSGNSTVHELVRFCAVGVANTVLDFGAYLALTRVFVFWSRHILWAAFVSWLLAVLFSYWSNSHWTFRRHRLRPYRLGRFIAVAAAGGVWNLLILGGLVRLGLFDVLAKVMATAVVVAWNFTLHKFWTFNARRTVRSSDCCDH